MEGFEIAAGSVIGREHVLAGRNNQDASALWSGPDLLAAVVCDGCGGEPSSEVGAHLGCRLTLGALQRHSGELNVDTASDVIAAVGDEILADLGRIADVAGQGTIGPCLLFTIVGAAVTRDTACVFAAGDGVVAVNDAVVVLSSADNAPDYLAYGLTGPETAARLRLVRALPAQSLRSLLIATDGAIDIIAAEGRRSPGSTGEVGPLASFWRDDRFFTNPFLLGRRLRQLNRATEHIDWVRRRVDRTPALLHDDTTLAVIRRKGGVT